MQVGRVPPRAARVVHNAGVTVPPTAEQASAARVVLGCYLLLEPIGRRAWVG